MNETNLGEPIENACIVSPLLAALQQELACGNANALSSFWHNVAKYGAPLIEAGTTAANKLVTFVWRDDMDSTISDVLIVINTLTDKDRHANTLSRHLMAQLENSDLWFKSYYLRSDFRASYQFYPYDQIRSRLTPETSAPRSAWRDIVNTALPDPFQPRTITARAGGPIMSILELPNAAPQPWYEQREGIARGHISQQQITSYSLAAERRVWAYESAITSTDQLAGILVLFDGETWVHSLDVGSTLDNLIGTERIPPLIALFVDSVDQTQRSRDLACSEAYADFVAKELLPWAYQRWPLPQQAQRVIVSGQSLGGLMSTFCCFRHSEQIGNVLSQSGAFWWSNDGSESEWLTEQFAKSALLPIRVHLTIGLLEWMLLPQNRRLLTVLQARGYNVTYREYTSGHDYASWRGGLADGLIALCEHWKETEYASL